VRFSSPLLLSCTPIRRRQNEQRSIVAAREAILSANHLGLLDGTHFAPPAIFAGQVLAGRVA
jgi:hypothetical protein